MAIVLPSREGSLPDLFFPADHSWLVSARWDDARTDIGGTAAVITVLHRNPLVTRRCLVRAFPLVWVTGFEPAASSSRTRISLSVRSCPARSCTSVPVRLVSGAVYRPGVARSDDSLLTPPHGSPPGRRAPCSLGPSTLAGDESRSPPRTPCPARRPTPPGAGRTSVMLLGPRPPLTAVPVEADRLMQDRDGGCRADEPGQPGE